MSAFIEETGRLVFMVRATTADDMRQVDLGEHNGNGTCSCWVYAKFIGPAIRNLKPDFSKMENRMDEKFACHHIKIARAYVADRLVQTVIKQFNDNDQKT